MEGRGETSNRRTRDPDEGERERRNRGCREGDRRVEEEKRAEYKGREKEKRFYVDLPVIQMRKEGKEGWKENGRETIEEEERRGRSERRMEEERTREETR